MESTWKIKVTELEGERQRILADMRPYSRKLSAVDAELEEAKEKLASASREPRVSDHAVVRYLERKHGFEFETVRKSIMTETVYQAIKAGASGVTYDGMRFKIADNCIVTII